MQQSQQQQQQHNTSSLAVLFGDDIKTNPAMMVQVDAYISKSGANKQAENLKKIFTTESTDTATVIVLPSRDPTALSQYLNDFVHGKLDNELSRELGQQVNNVFRIDFKADTNKVYALVRPALQLEQEIAREVDAIISEFASEILEQQQNKVTLRVESLQNFKDIDGKMSQGEPFITAFLQSIKAQVQFKVDQNLIAKVIETLKKKDKRLASTPIPLLQFFKSLNLFFAYKSANDLNPELRKVVFHEDNASDIRQHGFALYQMGPPEKDMNDIRKAIDLMDAGIEAYVTMKDRFAVHVTTNVPGLGDHIVKKAPANYDE